MARIKNIWFDQSGVLLDFNSVMEPVSRFHKLGFRDAEQYLGPYGQKDFVLQLERGEITPDEFMDILRRKTGREDLTYEEVEYAWLGFVSQPTPQMLEFLKELRQNYKICLMSNTNAIVQGWVRSPRFTPDGHSIYDYFDHLFVSNELHDYKPAPSIYLKALEKGNMKPEETLFIDDSMKNVEGARSVGINAIYVTSSSEVIDAIRSYLEAEK